MTNATLFLSAFNKIENHLRKILESEHYTEFSVLVREVSKRNTIVNSFKNNLREFAELRNVLVHKTIGNESIAEPHKQVVADIQKILKVLTKPPTAYDIASKPVEVCSIQDPIAAMVKIMQEKLYTHIPVYDEDHFVGIFSEATLVKWLSNSVEKGGFILGGDVVNDLRKYLDQPEDRFNCYKFISRDLDVFDIRDQFLGYVKGKKRLNAVLVTQSGKKTEKPLGIITAWDLPKVQEELGL